jgi:O-antigen chain-terminating methyltransferase
MSPYFDFFNRFRSPPDVVKQHQSIFLKYFKGCKSVLDIGCGRGEFLELLGENGIGCEGVDFNSDMIDYCRKKGLTVRQADAISYLEDLSDDSLDGIFTDDTVEHLDVAYLLHMLKLCSRKLIERRYMVAKTVNPLSWTAYASIYMLDTTHKNPLHPETMRFFMVSCGFREVKIEFVSQLPDDARLKNIVITGDMSAVEKRMAETYNHNIEHLNKAIYGPENYAAIAKR